MDKKPRVVNRTLSEQMAKILEDEIYHGVWQVGQKIPSESELIKMYGVSRNTLRETIHYLALTGVLEVRPGDGTYVRSRTVFDALLIKRLEHEDITMIMEIRELIEPKVMSLAAELRTEDELEHLLKLEHELEASFAQQSAEYIDKDIALHLYLAEICHNPFLSEIYHAVMKVYTPFLKQAYFSFLDNGVSSDHKQQCELIREQKADEVRKLSEEILMNEKKALRESGVL
ncbi:MAG: GntR family transcriptional regulator [Eubacteriales bacterium]|nr:GntR family transcriptional regulator [Eubacteriales bacterium]